MFERPSFNKKEADEKKPSNKGALLGAALLAGLGAAGTAEAQQNKDLSPEGQRMIEELLQKPEIQEEMRKTKERQERSQPRRGVQYEVRDRDGNIILKGGHDTGVVPIEKPNENKPN